MSDGTRPPLLSDEQRLAWLQLIRSDNVGPATFRDLVNHFGSAERALREMPGLSRRGGAKRAIKIADPDDAKRELDGVRELGGEIIALGEYGYPVALRHVDAPPPLLAVVGDFSIMERPTLAVVGSRNASIAGKKMAREIARGVGEAGYSIASGLALGIDGAAHSAALKTGTVAVFASGIDRVYPRDHRPLMREILEFGGAAVSEMPFGWEPRPRDFPRRNRIVSGMALAVLVIEAAERSGSLHTARFAAEQGRDVLAVPGSPLDPRAAGCNRLIQEGAVLITSIEDVLAVLEPLRERPVDDWSGELEEAMSVHDNISDPGDDDRSVVTQALGVAPVEIDELIRETGLPARTVQVILLELELAGRLERHGQGSVSLVM